MILFASGRTDVVAFYMPWLMNRLRAGFVDVRNPYYGQQVTRYMLNATVVDALVFCTKNPAPVLPYLDELRSFGIGIYFFVTITPYGKDVEPNVPDKRIVMQHFSELSTRIGAERMCWRYDPIFVNERYSVAAHIRYFRAMAEQLHGSTERCIISFIDLYEKTKKNFPGVQQVNHSDQQFLAQAFGRVAYDVGMRIETCAEQADLTAFGVEAGACLSRQTIEVAAGYKLVDYIPKQTLRQHCMCLPAHDIAAYNACPHLCAYCYANYDAALVRKNYVRHKPESSFLLGDALPDDVVHIAQQKSFHDQQMILL